MPASIPTHFRTTETIEEVGVCLVNTERAVKMELCSGKLAKTPDSAVHCCDGGPCLSAPRKSTQHHRQTDGLARCMSAALRGFHNCVSGGDFISRRQPGIAANLPDAPTMAINQLRLT